jgi:hypothetical protein
MRNINGDSLILASGTYGPPHISDAPPNSRLWPVHDAKAKADTAWSYRAI